MAVDVELGDERIDAEEGTSGGQQIPVATQAQNEVPAPRAASAQDRKPTQLDEVGRTVVKVAASTVLASTLVGALSEPPHVEMMSLPEPTPIVQLYQAVEDDPLVDEDDDVDDENSRWKRLLRALKYLLVVLALLGTLALGLLKGCAGLLATPLLPNGDDRQQEQSAQQTQTEDERGVALAS